MLYQDVPKQDRIVERREDGDSDESDDNYEPDPSEADDKERDGGDAAREEANAKDKGRIIKDEQDEIVKVEWPSFKRYFNYAGGWCLLIPYMIVLIIFIVVGLAITYYTQTWAYAPYETQQDEYWFYASIIFGLALASAILVFVRVNF